MHKYLSFLFSLFFTLSIFAQSVPEMGYVYADSTVPRVDILISPDSLSAIYNDVWSDKSYHATFVFTRENVADTVENVGFRLRGNTSRTAAKKSFKVGFNEFVAGQRYKGLENMNLNSDKNDPCVMRSKIGWDLLRMNGLAGARANHVEVYINQIYYGLYVNVEHIDERFIQKRFGNNNGNLYKCLYPADLQYLGSNPNDYKFEDNGRRAYELKINEDLDDYTDLAHFIEVLNNTPNTTLPCELEKVFNVSNYLEYMAFDVLMGNWDGYIYNKNNFYLYHNQATGQFEYLPYDLDNTLGIDWLGKDWGNRNIYTWKPSSSSELRPLYSKLLANQMYKDQYSYFLNKWIQKYFNNTVLNPIIDAQQTLIQPYVASDSFYSLDFGFTLTSFQNAINQSIGGQVAYGLKLYITTRRNNTISQLQLNNITPILRNLRTYQNNDTLYFQLQIEDDGALNNTTLVYNLNNGGIQTLNLYDDGQHLDNTANDGIFGTNLYLPNAINSLTYYIQAQDATNKVGRYPYCGSFTYPSTVTISEIEDSFYQLFPNPFQEKLAINFLKPAQLAIFDSMGKPVYQSQITGYQTLDTQNWASGFYFVLIQNESGRYVKQLIMKL